MQVRNLAGNENLSKRYNHPLLPYYLKILEAWLEVSLDVVKPYY